MLSDTHTHTHTDRQTKYCNPRCTCAPRVNEDRSTFTFFKRLRFYSLLRLNFHYLPTKGEVIRIALLVVGYENATQILCSGEACTTVEGWGEACTKFMMFASP